MSIRHLTYSLLALCIATSACTDAANNLNAADAAVTANLDGNGGTVTIRLPAKSAIFLQKIEPSQGPAAGGTVATLRGAGFQTGMTVSIGGNPATILKQLDAGQAVLQIPAGAAGPADIKVTLPDGATATLAGAFTYTTQAAPLSIEALIPVFCSSAGGTSVSLVGKGIMQGAWAYVGGVPVLGVEVIDSTVAIIVTPPLPSGQYDVYLSNPDGGTALVKDGLRAVEPTKMGPPPTVSKVTPTAGSALGGATVTVTGTQLDLMAQVLLDGKPVAAKVAPPNSLTFVAPKHEPGLVTLTVVNPDGQSAKAQSGFLYLPQVPVVYWMTPPEGPLAGTTQVQVVGDDFDDGDTVTIGGKPCAAPKVTAGNVITCTVPAGDAIGSVDVIVTTPSGLTGMLPKGYTYTGTAVAPTLQAVVPAEGPALGGNYLVLQGKNLPSDASVTVGGNVAAIVGATATAVVVIAPAGKAGPADVVVQGGNGTAKLANGYTYTEPPPAGLSACNPNHGPSAGGIAVAIQGANLPADGQVLFGAVPATTVVSASPTALVVILPPGVAGKVDVAVKSKQLADLVLPGGFTYDLAAAPKLDAVVPSKGLTAGGILVVLQGKNLAGDAKVSFGGKPASVSAYGTNGLTVLVPPGDVGPIDVAVSQPGFADAVLIGGFTYLAPAAGQDNKPALAQVSPNNGPMTGGHWAILKGSNLPSNAVVTFGGKAAAAVVAISGSIVSAKVPPSDKAGAVDVVIANPDNGQQAKATAAYTYYDPKQAKGPPPKLVSIKPTLGPSQGNTLALLEGNEFADGVLVFFGGRPSPGVHGIASTSLSAWTPPAPPGAASVMVVHPDGQFSELDGGFLYVPTDKSTLTVQSAQPAQGSAAGGTDVLLSGSGFATGMLVFVDYAPVVVAGKGAKAASFTTPAHPPGQAPVHVTSPDGWTAELNGGYLFVLEQPYVAAVSPPFGAPGGGSKVIITGKGFHPKAKVAFGGAEAQVVAATASAIEVVTPAGKAGKVDVLVTNPDFLSDALENGFEYTDAIPGQALQIKRVVPVSGSAAGGTLVQLQGANFDAGITVLLGDKIATSVKVLSPSLLQCVTPPHAAGPVAVKLVSVAKGTASADNQFFYVSDPSKPAPVLQTVEPGLGPTSGGTIAWLTGQNFAVGAQVVVGGVPAKVLGGDSQGLAVEMPPHAAGPADVIVYTPDSQPSALLDGFVFYDPPAGWAPPLLTKVAPGQGSTAGGDDVALTGTGLASGSLTLLGWAKAKEQGLAGNVLTVTAPAHAPGLVDVAVTRPDGGSALLKAAFSFAAPAPMVELIFPKVGPLGGGTTLVVSGKNFLAGAALTVGGLPAGKVVVASSEVLTAVVPAGKAAGAADVVVANPDGQTGQAPAGFEYLDTPQGPAPKPQTVVPNVGPYQGGTVAVLWGEGFGQGAAVLVGGKPAKVHAGTAGWLTFTTPPGFNGPADIVVVNPDGQGGTLGAGFTYKTATLPAPKLLGITPATGPASGSTPVILTGSKFMPGGIGFVGYRPLSSWSVLNAAIATGTTLTMPAGQHDVVATNGDGQSTILSGAFLSVDAPKIDSFTPALGPVAGGTLLTLAGKEFQPGAKVLFAGKESKSVVVLSGFVAKVVAPPGLQGPAQVTILNPDGQTHTALQPYLYTLPPELTSVFPPKGSALGGTPLIVRGKNLLPGAKVSLGGKAASKVVVVSPEVLTAFAPAGTADQTVDVLIDNPDGVSALGKGLYTYVDPSKIGAVATVEALVPPTGPSAGGTWGLAIGKNFAKDAQALFGAVPATAFEVASATQARFVSPPAQATSTVDVTVIHPDGGWATKPKAFTYTDEATLAPPPKVTGLEPSSGSTLGGTAVVFSGSGFAADAVMFFDLNAAVLVVKGPKGTTATTPAHAKGSVDVRVTNTEGRTSLWPMAYTYVAPPKVDGIKPGEGPSAGGTLVTISGDEFTLGDNAAKSAKVLFCAGYLANDDCVAAAPEETIVKSTTQIVAAVPAHASGLADVVVVNPDGQAGILGKGFLFRAPPKIQDIQPSTGSTLGGTAVKIIGTGFVSGAKVKFGTADGVACNVVDPGLITCTSPPGSAGPVAVSIANLDGSAHTLNGAFVYLAPPKIVNIFPSMGPEKGGTVITIQGDSFVQGVKGSKVEIGGKVVPDSDLNVQSSGIISAKTPSGTGPAAIKVINPDGQFAVKAGGFVYIPDIKPPKISNVTPKFGPTAGGYVVSVYGNDFQEGAIVAIGNDSVGWVNATNANVINAGTLIVATAPAHDPGLFDVKVSNSAGQMGVLKDGFEYTAPLQLPGLAFAGITPTRGPAAGGYEATIYGQGFLQGAKVYFGDSVKSIWTEATKVTVLGPTLLKITIPAASANGPADVRVANPAVGGKASEVVGKGAFVYGQAVILASPLDRIPIDVSKSDYYPLIFDANGDGINDILVTGNRYRDDLFIGVKGADGKSGGFIDQSLQLIPEVKEGPCYYRADPVAIDIDKDGDLDVMFRATYYGDHRLCLYINKGDGTMTVQEKLTPGTATTAYELGDLNCDGITDILVVRSNQQKYIWIGNGLGGYTSVTTALPNHIEPAVGAVIGDVDNDGDNDIIVANDSAVQTRLYYNNCNNVAKGQPWSFSDAVYGAGKNFPISGYNSRDVLLEDLNGDGWKDCVLVNWGQSTRVYFNTGGNFGTDDGKHFPQTETLTQTLRVSAVDVDLDGDKDLVLLKYHGDWQYWPTVYISDKAQGGTAAFTDASSVNLPPWRGEDGAIMAIGDVNSDKLPDIYLARVNHQDYALMNNGYAENKAELDSNRVPKGSFANNTQKNIPEDIFDSRHGVTGDIDGDGDLDIVMTAYASSWGRPLRIWLNDGTGAFFDDTDARVADFKCHASRVRLVDLNGDKDLDILMSCYYDYYAYGAGLSNTSGGLRQFVNDGTGKFKDVTAKNMPDSYNTTRYSNISVGDLDGDGDMDAIGTGIEPCSKVLIHGGDPFNTGGAFYFTNDTLFSACNNQYNGWTYEDAIITDLNGDGFNDVYVGNWNGQNSLWHNDGTGKMTNVTLSHLPAVADNTRCVLALDVDLDKDIDLFAVNSGISRMQVSELDYKYSDITASHMPTGLNLDTMGAAVADFDFDGLPDIAMAVWGAQNQLLMAQGEGYVKLFTTSMPADSDYSRWMLPGDFDGDGRVDLFVVNNGPKRIYFNLTPKK